MFSGMGTPRQLAAQVLNFALILSSAFMVRLENLSPPIRITWLCMLTCQ